MPTELEMRFLSNLLDGMDSQELRGLVMHEAERDFEIVGEEALKINEDRGHQTQPQIRHDRPAEINPNQAVIESESSISYTCMTDVYIHGLIYR
jgi:hypothetical protein